MKKRVLALTPGDPAGIGPEITWKAIQSGSIDKNIALLCVGAREPFEKLKVPILEANPLSGSFQPPEMNQPHVWLWPAPLTSPHGSLLEGYQVGWSIEQATQLVLKQAVSALVTGPISKERLQKGGYIYPGHTEFLAALCQTREVTMMLANSILRVSLVTTHLGIQDVSLNLTREKIRKSILQTVQGLRDFWGIEKPRIAVTALNPHAGEKGLFGKEEITTIQPEIESLKKSAGASFTIDGPFPADTFFAKHILTPAEDRYDAVVCMYHDQGLIPVKLLDFHNTVNVTLGLPMIRTSVDHGVGFDIAGKGVADPSSLLAAIKLATHFVEKRHGKN